MMKQLFIDVQNMWKEAKDLLNFLFFTLQTLQLIFIESSKEIRVSVYNYSLNLDSKLNKLRNRK